MLQLTPQSRIFVATAPVDFRKGIDGLAAVCRQVLGDNPDIPHGGPDFGEFLSIKPCIPLSQELE